MARKEKTVRIGIGQDGKPLSAVWRIWLYGSDVYIAPRNIAHVFKTSLHASGKFRHAFVTDEASERFRPAGSDRAVSKWNRPAPQTASGTLLFQLLFPESELHPARHDEPLTADVVWLPRPPAGAVTYVTVLELADHASGRTPQFQDVVSTTPIVSWQTDTGSTVWVMAFVAPITAEQAREVARLRAEMMKQTAGMNLNDQAPEPHSHLRSFGIFEPPDGIGRIVDIDAEFLRSSVSDDDRHRRIAGRAYFLWQNRTGQQWWDAMSNWCEAERLEDPDRAT